MSSSFLRTAVTGIVVAAVLVTVVWLVARATGDDLRVQALGQDDKQKMAIFLPAFVTVLWGAIGAGVVLLLRRRPRGRVIFLALAAVLLVIQGIQAFTATDSNGTAIWLNVMHLVAAGAIVSAYLRLFARAI